MNLYTIFNSPIGDLLAVGDGESLSRLHMLGSRKRVALNPVWQRDDDALDDVRTQLDEYFAGGRREFDLQLDMIGNPFELRVWDALCEIPYGETISYGELAKRVGNPKASRAVGAANGQNPIPIVIPCHRVIGANGKLTGFGGGLPTKEALLALETKQFKLAE